MAGDWEAEDQLYAEEDGFFTDFPFEGEDEEEENWSPPRDPGVEDTDGEMSAEEIAEIERRARELNPPQLEAE